MIEEIVQYRDGEKLSWDKIGNILSIHPEKARALYRRNKKGHPSPGPSEPVLAPVITPGKTDWRNILSLANSNKELAAEMNPSTQFHRRTIETDKPIIILFTGDWHLGAVSTDYLRWRKDMERVMDTENVYMFLLADEIENMRTFKTLAAVLTQVLTPQAQAKLLSGIVDELCTSHKLLGKVTGNHDTEFEERQFGSSPTRDIFVKAGVPVFSNRGIIELTVGTQTYSILGFHKSRFRSAIRPTHGAYQEWRFGYPADIVAGAHDHQPGFEAIWNYTAGRDNGKAFGGQTYLIKIGTYSDSEYGHRYFHNGGFPIMPCVVLYPDQNKKVYFDSLDDAITFVGDKK